MRLGLVLPTFPQGDASGLRSLAETARAAERAGVDGLWACDHLFWHGPVVEPFVALTVAAGATAACTVGTAVLQLPLRSSAVVARTAASLQVLSGGRVVLGVGTGSHAGEYAAAGVPFDDRGARLDRGIVALRRAWDAERAVDGYALQPATPRIPVWVGGSRAPARRRAVAHGDGWIPMFVSPQRYKDQAQRLDAELRAAGRPASSCTKAVFVFLAVGEDSRSRERALGWMSSLYRLDASRFASHLVHGPADACAAALAEYGRAGAEHAVVFVADDDPLPHVAGLRAAMPPEPGGAP